MNNKDFLFAAAATMMLALATGAVPMMLPRPAAAQSNPTMSNVIPDGGRYAIRGKVQAIDATAGTMTVVTDAGQVVPLVVARGVDLQGIGTGDRVSGIYNRSVTFMVTPPREPGAVTPTSTVGQVAHTPGGVGAGAMVLTGRVVKVDGSHSFDVVDASGGGIYTINITDPARMAMVPLLHVGDAISVSISPLVLIGVAECGFFGC